MSTERETFEDEIHPDIVTDPSVRKATVYCINSCSTCKTAKSELEDAGYMVIWRNVRGADMGLADFENIEEAVGWERMVNKKSRTWRELPDGDKEGLNRESALELLVRKPTLMKRPIIDVGDDVLVGWTDEVKETLKI